MNEKYLQQSASTLNYGGYYDWLSKPKSNTFTNSKEINDEELRINQGIVELHQINKKWFSKIMLCIEITKKIKSIENEEGYFAINAT